MRNEDLTVLLEIEGKSLELSAMGPRFIFYRHIRGHLCSPYVAQREFDFRNAVYLITGRLPSPAAN